MKLILLQVGCSVNKEPGGSQRISFQCPPIVRLWTRHICCFNLNLLIWKLWIMMLNSLAKCLTVELEEAQMLLVDMNHVILTKKKRNILLDPLGSPVPSVLSCRHFAKLSLSLPWHHCETLCQELTLSLQGP